MEGKNAASFTDFLRKRRVFRLALQEQPIYRRCIAPYTGAAALVRQADHYSHLDERRERYQSAVEKKEEKIPFAVTAFLFPDGMEFVNKFCFRFTLNR